MEEEGVKVDGRLSERLGLQGWVLLEPHPEGQEQSVTEAPSTLSVLNVQTGLCCNVLWSRDGQPFGASFRGIFVVSRSVGA